MTVACLRWREIAALTGCASPTGIGVVSHEGGLLHEATVPRATCLRRWVSCPTRSPVPARCASRSATPASIRRIAIAAAGSRDRPGYPLIIPHSDGAGEIDKVGAGVEAARIGERVWTWNAQRGRAFGTAAEYVCLPSAQAVPMPAGVPLELGAGFGVPAMTAYFSLFSDGPLEGRDVLVTGAAGAVGLYAAQFARPRGRAQSRRHRQRRCQGQDRKGMPASRSSSTTRRTMSPSACWRRREKRGVDRISEVDFGGNLATTLAVMREGCVIGTYASRGEQAPTLPFYPLLFANIVVRFIQCSLILGELRAAGSRDLNRWSPRAACAIPPRASCPSPRSPRAHELVESRSVIGKVMLAL